MTASLADELNAHAVDTDGVHQALRYYLAELLDDLPQQDMLERMHRAAGQEQIDSACADLVRDPVLLEDAALAVLSDAWADESERDRLRAVLSETNDKLPVVEVIAIAIMCMYGMYLWSTGGKKKSEERTIKRPDGSFERTVKVEYTDPTGPLGALGRLFHRQ